MDVNGKRDVFDDCKSVGQGALESCYDDDGMDIALELRQGISEDFTS